MINEYQAKRYCSDEISLIENYQDAISDEEKMWDIHHRRECDENGRTLFTRKQLIEMGLYFKRPASELIFVKKSMHKKLHREQMILCAEIVKEVTFKSKPNSKPLQITLDWDSVMWAEDGNELSAFETEKNIVEQIDYMIDFYSSEEAI